MEITWTDHMKRGEVMHKFNEQRNISRTVKRRKANRITHILLRNCF